MTHPLFRSEIFVETAFERRFQAMLRSALHKRSWHAIVADPGSGKTMGIREIVQTTGSPVILAITAPKNNDDEQALGDQLFAALALALLFNVAYPSYVPSLLERDRLVEGNSKLELSQSVATSIGPGLAGILIQVVMAPLTLFVDACSFLFSAVTVAWIRIPETSPKREATHSHMGQEMKEGIRFLTSSPLLRALTSCYAMLSFFNSLLEAIFILYLIKEVGIQPALLGIIFAVGSIGFILGALLCGKVTKRVGVGTALLIAPMAVGISDALLPLAHFVSHSFAFFLVGFAQFVFGLAIPLFRINQLSLRQAITPENLQGRVHASISLLTYGLPFVGALLGGVLGQALGLPQTLCVAATGEILSCIWIFFSPIRKMHEQP